MVSKTRIQNHIDLHAGWAALRNTLKREMRHGRKNFTFAGSEPRDIVIVLPSPKE